MKYAAFLFLAIALLAVGGGPYQAEDDARTAEAGRATDARSGRLSAFIACAATEPTTTVATDAVIGTPAGDNTTSTPTPESTATAITPNQSPRSSPTPCGDIIATATIDPTSTETPQPVATAIPSASPIVLTPFDIETETLTPKGDATGTPTPAETLDIEATQTYRAGPQPYAYLSIGDGLQWGCCGALGSSSLSLFRDYLEGRIGRPVIWQSPGSGTTQRGRSSMVATGSLGSSMVRGS